ncbi:hypothetical protein [Paenalcaligenes suwonensis]|uniref:hypothetical protein n=1 Tax=Paenalcaligenes suwonensis TaxID=1202713 RepID=UPI00140BBCD2|nr:hypothetical protein [Paenalcaligenes suwonensis]NHC63073.1 hypothetical protein [Paenalcaligenes suwonensis]
MKLHSLDHPLYWYKYNVSGSIEILDAYISDVEQQVDKSTANFKANSEEVVIEGVYKDEPPTCITVYKGLNGGSWDLNAIFLEYFPNLQRRSALITLFAFFEHELNKLCALFQATEKYQLSLKDVAGVGIARARTYLSKVALVDLTDPPKPWSDIKNIQALRNLVVHADGRLPQDGQTDRSALHKYIENNELLTGDREVVLRAGYLKYSLTCFDEYFTQIDKAIHQRYNG